MEHGEDDVEELKPVGYQDTIETVVPPGRKRRATNDEEVASKLEPSEAQSDAQSEAQSDAQSEAQSEAQSDAQSEVQSPEPNLPDLAATDAVPTERPLYTDPVESREQPKAGVQPLPQLKQKA